MSIIVQWAIIAAGQISRSTFNSLSIRSSKGILDFVWFYEKLNIVIQVVVLFYKLTLKNV